MNNKYSLILGLLVLTQTSLGKVHIDTSINALPQLVEKKIIKRNDNIRLHLGCGQTYFHQYVNIDYPLSEHTSQTRAVADAFADVSLLKFPTHSIDEIRSHHFFEHFDRPTALALLRKWHQWLKVGGKLVIETPDLQKCISILANDAYSYRDKQITLRHVFGSHEASWAYHYDGWYKEKYERILAQLGFHMVSFQHISHPGYELVPNILVTATKIKDLTDSEYRLAARNILKSSLVKPTETRMLGVWERVYTQACNKMNLKEGQC